jgi:hypothetical protein
VRERNGPKNTYQRMINVHGEDAPSYFTIKFWSKQFRRGRDSLQHDPRCGRRVKAKTNDNSKKEVGISEATWRFRNEWIPKLLSPE